MLRSTISPIKIPPLPNNTTTTTTTPAASRRHHHASQATPMGSHSLTLSLGILQRVSTSRSHRRISTAAATRSTTTTTTHSLLSTCVEALFKFPPIFSAAAKGARKKIVDRGADMGLDFQSEIDALKSVDWEAEIAQIVDMNTITYPDYYQVPFHAYEKGNLSVEAALEVTVAATSVHATVMDPEGKRLDPEGDTKLRSSYSACMKQLLHDMGAATTAPIRDILDIGAATGLSSMALLRAFPNANVTGIDISPHFVAVGKYLQRQREQQSGTDEPFSLVHGVAEHTPFADASFDLVSICLVCHELPEHASRAIFKEAGRLLRPGGALAIMEMNPGSPVFQRVMKNPVAYTVFKSTEPYLLEYVEMDMAAAIKDAGVFGDDVRQLENSPRHRTVVAIKQAT